MREGPSMTEAIDRFEAPDFAALYAPSGVDTVGTLTPRLAYRLWYAAQVLSDEWRVDPVPEFLADDLPIIARSFASEPAWLGRFAQCFDAIEDWLAGTRTGSIGRCTGEELALHVVVELAEAFTADGIITKDGMKHLPDQGNDDVAFGAVTEYLLDDHDVLMLFMPHLDGIEEQEPLLHPSRWFVPFYGGDDPRS